MFKHKTFWFLGTIVSLAACAPFLRYGPTGTPSIGPLPVHSIDAPLSATEQPPPQFELLQRIGRGQILGISISPDGETLIVASTIGVWIYNIGDESLITSIEGQVFAQYRSIRSYADILWSPDGTMVAIGIRGNGIWIWDANTWDLLVTKEPVSNSELSWETPGFSWAPESDFLALGIGNGEILVWNRDTNTWETKEVHIDRQISMAWTAQGRLIILGLDADFNLGLYDGETDELIRVFDQEIEGSETIIWSPSGEYVFVAAQPGVYGGVGYSMLDVSSGQEIFEPRTGTVAWSQKGHFFAYEISNNEDTWVEIWDTETNSKTTLPVQWHILWMTWDGNENLYAVGYSHGELFLWDLITGETLMSLNEHLEYNRAISTEDAPDDLSLLYYVGGPFWLFDWDYTNMESRGYKDFDPQERIEGVREYLFSPDLQTVAIERWSLEALLWDISNNETYTFFTQDEINPTYSVEDSAFSPDSRYLALEAPDARVQIWDLQTKQLMAEYSLPGGGAVSIQWSPDQNYLAINVYEHGVIIYDMRLNEKIVEFPVMPDESGAVSWSPDSIHIGYVARNNRIVVGNAVSGDVLHHIYTKHNYLFDEGVFWSPDGKIFGASGGDGFSLFDTETGALIVSIKDDSFYQTMSPDGRLLAAATDGNLIRIYDATNGAVLAELPGHGAFIDRIRWSEDGSKLYTSSYDGTIIIWTVSQQQ